MQKISQQVLRFGGRREPKRVAQHGASGNYRAMVPGWGLAPLLVAAAAGQWTGTTSQNTDGSWEHPSPSPSSEEEMSSDAHLESQQPSPSPSPFTGGTWGPRSSPSPGPWPSAYGCSRLPDGDLGLGGQLTAFDPSAEETCEFAVPWLVAGYNSGAEAGGYERTSEAAACDP